MKTKKLIQIEVIQEKDGDVFTEKVNRKLQELSSVLELTFPEGQGFCAMIKYEVEETVPEDTADEFYQKHGKTYCCNDCPFLELDPDRRSASHWCSLHKDRVRLKAICCDDFYQGLLDGIYHVVTPEERNKQFSKMDEEEFERRIKFRSELQEISRHKRAKLKAEKELVLAISKRLEMEKRLKENSHDMPIYVFELPDPSNPLDSKELYPMDVAVIEHGQHVELSEKELIRIAQKYKGKLFRCSEPEYIDSESTHYRKTVQIW